MPSCSPTAPAPKPLVPAIATAFAGDAIELVCEHLEITNPRRPRFLPGRAPPLAVRPWEHAITVMADGEALRVRGALFGELGFEASFACEHRASSRGLMWLFDARAFTYIELPMDEMSRHLTERVAREGWSTKLHRERPRGHLLERRKVNSGDIDPLVEHHYTLRRTLPIMSVRV